MLHLELGVSVWMWQWFILTVGWRSLPEDKSWFSSALFLVHHLCPVVLVQLYLCNHVVIITIITITVIIISYLLTFTNILNSNITTTTYTLFCLTSKNLGMLRAKETMVTGTVYTSNRFVLLIAFKRNKYNCKYMTLHVYMTFQGTSTAQKVMICNFHIEEVLGWQFPISKRSTCQGQCINEVNFKGNIKKSK